MTGSKAVQQKKIQVTAAIRYNSASVQ